MLRAMVIGACLLLAGCSGIDGASIGRSVGQSVCALLANCTPGCAEGQVFDPDFDKCVPDRR